MATIYKQARFNVWIRAIFRIAIQIFSSTIPAVTLFYTYITYFFEPTLLHYFIALFWLLLCLEIFTILFVVIGGFIYKSTALSITQDLQVIEGKNLENYFIKTIFFTFSETIVNKLWYQGVKFFYKSYGAKLGSNVDFGGSEVRTPVELLEIESNTLVAKSIICTHVQEGGKHIIGKIKIGKNCTIGLNSIILPNVEIGNESIIGANSVVPKGTKIPPNEIWMGCPAKKLKEIKK